MNQVKAIEDYARRNGIELVKVFRDDGITGASDPFKREEFIRMVEFCRNEGIRLILIYDLSRLGRSLITAVASLKKLIDEGFSLIFTRHNLKADLSDPMSKVVIYTLLMVAELERDFTRIRQEEAWRQGKQKGRPKKVSDDIILKYYRKYGKYGTKKYVWLRMREDGHDISYDRFIRRLKAILRR